MTESSGARGFFSNVFGQLGGCLVQVLIAVAVPLLCVFGASLIAFVIPLGGILAALWLIDRFEPEKLKPYSLGVAFQSGLLVEHFVALLFLKFYLVALPSHVVWEGVGAAAALAWMIAGPGTWPAILLVLYNLFTIVVRLSRFGAGDASFEMLPSLLSHIVYAGLAVFFLLKALVTARTGRRREAEPRLDVKAEVAAVAGAIRAGVYASAGLTPPAAPPPAAE